MLAISSSTSRALLGTRTQVSSSALNTRVSLASSCGSLQRRPGLVGVDGVQAEALGVGDHAGEGEFGRVPLAPAVFEQVVEPDKGR